MGLLKILPFLCFSIHQLEIYGAYLLLCRAYLYQDSWESNDFYMHHEKSKLKKLKKFFFYNFNLILLT